MATLGNGQRGRWQRPSALALRRLDPRASPGPPRAGIVQTALYLDFFYNYINAKRQNIDAPIELPA
eukprot:495511-Prymnesium_polylepis.1